MLMHYLAKHKNMERRTEIAFSFFTARFQQVVA